jgi:hypothetical protein
VGKPGVDVGHETGRALVPRQDVADGIAPLVKPLLSGTEVSPGTPNT